MLYWNLEFQYLNKNNILRSTVDLNTGARGGTHNVRIGDWDYAHSTLNRRKKPTYMTRDKDNRMKKIDVFTEYVIPRDGSIKHMPQE